ncbi:integral membrane protein DUF92-domain-containing protein [Globomyces pollinis-pini]|nr:integral membrane protein DUF92-domain-containing protein [Globomyces pollinis-pini]
MGIMLIAFYYASSKLTHYKKEIKSKLEEFESQRNSIQVFCNSIWILLCALIDSFTNYNLQTSIGCLCILACCCGDTWASELGTVWASKPRLITTFKVVPPGTNGGISVGGSFASLLGGMFIGLNYYILSIYFNELHLLSFFSAIAIGSAAGFIGSMIDSLMGATIQVSLYCKKRKLIVKKPSVDTVVVSGLPFMNNEMVSVIHSL